jgi:hypothetical protein
MDEERNLSQLLQLAARAGGVLPVTVALSLGWSRDQLRTLVLELGWSRPVTGLLAAPGVAAAHPLVRLRALQARHPYLVVSHRTAAVLLGIDVLRRPGEPDPLEGELECIDPRAERPRVRRPGFRVHRSALSAGEVMTVRGLRLTSSVRTVTDLLRSGQRNFAVAALDTALRKRLVSLAEVAAALEEGSQLCRRRAWEAFRLADPRAESVSESEARLAMHDAGLRPRSQALVLTPGGVRRLDFLFEAEGLGVEPEGRRHHWTRPGHQRDARRFNDLGACRKVRHVLRYTWEDVFLRPEAMIAEIQAHLRRLRGNAGRFSG